MTDRAVEKELAVSEYERGIRDGVRFRMTHVEQFTAELGEPRTENGHYHIAMVPDRVVINMLPASASHHERMIGIVSDLAVAALSGGKA